MKWKYCAVALAITVAVSSGCGGPESGVVSGTVTHAGQPVAFGNISFLSSDGWTGSSGISEGKYRIESAPLGKMKVMVQAMQTPMLISPPPAKGMPAPPAPKVVPVKPLPPQYADATQTPLTYEVTAGEQTKDFDIPKK